MKDPLRRFLIRGWCLLALLPLLLQAARGEEEASLRPGVNERYLAADLDVDHWLGVFEGESREIFRSRRAIVEALGLEPGMRAADIGAGTGLFLGPIAKAVGPAGRLYANEISPRFVEHLRSRAAAEGLSQVEVVKGGARATGLAEAAVDLVFVCDVYHHFEYPKSMLADLHRVLRPGGRLVLVDFERIPERSRDWVVEHVRAGKTEVIAEVAASGFVFEAELEIEGLDENYMLRFRRP